MSQKANYADITNSIRKLLSHCIGHSRGSVSTKILALCDALGNLLKFALMPGQRTRRANRDLAKIQSTPAFGH